MSSLADRGTPQTGPAAVHPVDEILPAPRLFALGLQHVLAMYAGAVAVPLLVGSALKLSPEQIIYLINADLLVSGIASLIQAVGIGPIGVRLPLIQGVTFTAVTPMILIGQQYGVTAIYGAVIVSGVVGMLASPLFSRLLRFFPPLVMGTVITTIGVTLMPVAVLWAGGGNPEAPDFGNPAAITLATFTLAVVLCLASFAQGFVRNTAVLIGIVVGTVAAMLFGMTNFAEVGKAEWVGVSTPFHFGLPTFHLVPILVMVVVMLVTMTETTSDILAVGEMVDRPATPEDLKRGLLADGFCTMLGGIFNTFPYTAFAENVGLVGLSRVKSRFVVAAAGAILIVFGLFPKAAAIVASIPTPVIGGAGLVMFGMVAATGIRILHDVKFEGTNSPLIIGVSIGLGLIPVTMPHFYQHAPPGARILLDSGIATGALAAVLLNLVLNWGHHTVEDDPHFQTQRGAHSHL
jgi:uric acid transporter